MASMSLSGSVFLSICLSITFWGSTMAILVLYLAYISVGYIGPVLIIYMGYIFAISTWVYIVIYIGQEFL